MKIPITIITGFLGAGKTTLIRHLIKNSHGVRIALIVNEFGSLGVDKELINGSCFDSSLSPDIIELANGCICCTVSEDFVPTIESLIELPEPPDHIIVETSGLAMPKSLVQAFNWPELRSRVTVDGVVAIIDGPSFKSDLFFKDTKNTLKNREADLNVDHDNPLREVFEDQLLCADLVIINKIDLLENNDLSDVQTSILQIVRPGVKVLSSIRCALNSCVILGVGNTIGQNINYTPHLHDHDEFESFVVKLASIEDPKSLEDRISQAAETYNILRVKGFVEVSGKDMRHVIQAVGPRVDRYYDRPWNKVETRSSALVVIGETGLDKDAIVRTLQG